LQLQGAARGDEPDDQRDVQLQALPLSAGQAGALPQPLLPRAADEPDGVFPVLGQRQQRGGLPGRRSHLTSADGPAPAAPQEIAQLALSRTLLKEKQLVLALSFIDSDMYVGLVGVWWRAFYSNTNSSLQLHACDLLLRLSATQ